jgi:hypothetical protein
MPTLRAEIEERLQSLPEPPFFARLLDPRQHLTQFQLAQAPYLRSSRLFVVSEIALDRCYEQPGIWLRAVDSIDKRSSWVPKFMPKGAPMWLDLNWCTLFDLPGILSGFKAN